MESVIAILLWLQVVATGNQYTAAQIDDLIELHQHQISIVYHDPELLQYVLSTTGNEVSEVIIIHGD